MSIRTEPLGSLYDSLAAAKPAPAGVTASAVSAQFGMALLIKALEITVRRKDFAGNAETVRGWLAAARRHSEILAESADEDITATADRKRLEIPMNAARSATAGLDLCAEAVALVRGALAADVGAAAVLLCGAARAILICVDSNAGALEVEARRELERHVLAREKAVLEALRS